MYRVGDTKQWNTYTICLKNGTTDCIEGCIVDQVGNALWFYGEDIIVMYPIDDIKKLEIKCIVPWIDWL